MNVYHLHQIIVYTRETSNQTLAMKNGFLKLIQEERTKLWWNYRGKITINTKEVYKVYYEACE